MAFIVLDAILKFIPKGRSLKNELYTKPDEIYSIWVLGYNLGVIIIELKYGDKNNISDSIIKFGSNYEKVKNWTTKIVQDNSTINDLLTGLQADNENGFLKELESKIFRICDFLAFDISNYSSHLASLFNFGFGYSKLRSVLLFPDTELHIKLEIDSILENIRQIEKGDKKLESPNLEISETNLKIISLSLKLMKKKVLLLFKFAKESNEAYFDYVNNIYFKFITDIILDIKNPANLIENKHKWLLFIVYYYILVIYILVIYQCYMGMQKYIPDMLNSFIKMDFKESDVFVSVVLPIVALGFFYSFKYLNKRIVELFIGYRIGRSLRKIQQVK